MIVLLFIYHLTAISFLLYVLLIAYLTNKLDAEVVTLPALGGGFATFPAQALTHTLLLTLNRKRLCCLIFLSARNSSRPLLMRHDNPSIRSWKGPSGGRDERGASGTPQVYNVQKFMDVHRILICLGGIFRLRETRLRKLNRTSEAVRAVSSASVRYRSAS